jgi:hypothetical protein
MGGKKTPKPKPRPPELSREEAVRKVVQQYIDDQRTIIEKADCESSSLGLAARSRVTHTRLLKAGSSPGSRDDGTKSWSPQRCLWGRRSSLRRQGSIRSLGWWREESGQKRLAAVGVERRLLFKGSFLCMGLFSIFLFVEP